MIDEVRHQAIRDILSRHSNAIPVKVGALAAELGLGVVLATLQPGISGQIEPSEKYQAGFLIKVNRYEVKERQRFTIAHEIGHYVLHTDRIGAGIRDTILYRSKLSSVMEVQANRFAADLLMPSHKVAEYLAGRRIVDKDVARDLAREFEVSVDAMEIRLGVR